MNSWLRRHPWIFYVGGLCIGVIATVLLADDPASSPKVVASTTESAMAPPKLAPAPALPPPVVAPPVVAPPVVSPPVVSLPVVSPLPRPPAAPSSGKSTWQQFALAVPSTGGRPVIAIVIDDMGLDRPDAARVLLLPGPLTIAFMSYAEDLDIQSRAARAAGDEIWLHVPMEPMDGELDAGPNVLKTELTPEENRRRLDWAIERLPGIVGINNHMGSKFTQSRPGMELVMQDLKARGLAFLDSRTIASTIASEVAGEVGVPHIDRDVFIDNDESVEAVLRQLQEVERLATKRGFALAIGHPHPTTIAALIQWLPTLKAKGFALVPASALLRLQISSSG